MSDPIVFTFRTKLDPITYYGQEEVDHVNIRVPRPAENHIDRAAMRRDKEWSDFSNSSMLFGCVSRALGLAGVGKTLRLDRLPESVTVDTSGFLAVVTVQIPSYRA